MDNLHINDIIEHFPGDTVWVPERYDAKVVCGKCSGAGRITAMIDDLEYYRTCPICDGRNWGLHSKQYYVYNEYHPKKKVISEVTLTISEQTDVRYSVEYDTVITYSPENVFKSEEACRKFCELVNQKNREDAEQHVWHISDQDEVQHKYQTSSGC